MEKNRRLRLLFFLGLALIILIITVFTKRRCLLVNNLIQLLGAPLTFFLLFMALTPLSILTANLLFRPQTGRLFQRFSKEKDLLSLAILISMVLIANLAFLIIPNLICSIWNLVNP